ncbi:MAG: Vi polysaccharide biosynthesis UDP-N-acetylglucosamine C-6 dehydrogenase TviB, partial [Mycoplasmatales bacterium]
MKLSVIGVGYVGIHPVTNFSKLGHEVIGFDISEKRIASYNSGVDPIGEVGDDTIKDTTASFTTNLEDIKGSDIYIIAVPTDIDENFNPDLKPLESASKAVGSIIGHGEIVVYESTVHPGATEKYCFPILSKESNKIIGQDFDVVYTPERVDPGNKINTVQNTPRVIGGTRIEATEKVAKLYEEYIVKMVRVTDIKTA